MENFGLSSRKLKGEIERDSMKAVQDWKVSAMENHEKMLEKLDLIELEGNEMLNLRLENLEQEVLSKIKFNQHENR